MTPALLPWIKASDIQPKIKGSDHCPVYVDFHEEIKRNDGQIIKLKDLLQCCRDPPRLAANNWDEYSGKQKVLDTFFSKKIAQEIVSQSQSSCATTPLSKRKQDTSDVPEAGAKRLKPMSPLGSSKKQGNTQPKQAKLSGFFSDPAKAKGKGKVEEIIDQADVDSDFQLALSLSQDAEPVSSSNSSQSSDKSASESWSSILAPLKPPLCTVHQEPAKELRVTKKGANKGKGFWICAR